MKNAILPVFAALAACSAAAADLKVTADRIAADRPTGSFVASGHVHAVSAPFSLISELVSKDEEGRYRFDDPTMVTTCTNDAAHLHWSVTGEVEYQGEHYLKVRDVVVRAWNVPLLWVPYWYYPLDEGNGWRVMPGYTSRWGAYLMSKYVYHLWGSFAPGEVGFGGSTRLDLRSKNGLALGQTVRWQLGEFGRGSAKVYYAWDEDSDRYKKHWNDTRYRYSNWGSDVPFHRYGVNVEHRWEATERDTVRMRLGVFSDSHFRRDFLRQSLFGVKNEFLNAIRNEIAWEHAENSWAAGVSVSGPINDFYGGTARLPEFYFDVAPQPIADLPVNYESQTRAGFLARKYAEYGDRATPLPFRYSPGPWADYRTFRFDSYQRLTAPFKVADILSVVPRIAYRGTFWGEAGETQVSGREHAGKTGDQPWRSVFESGVTFAARGRGRLTDMLTHVIEPYFDVLAQQVEYHGLGGASRPYVFDSLDASCDWLDQYAGRSRNLPYSWYGITPGVRNVLRKTDEKGNSRTLFDLDIYAALQFNHAHYTAGDRNHRLSDDPANPNYGKSLQVVPGLRARWNPTSDIALAARGEYDTEHNVLAYSSVSWNHRLADDFKYQIAYSGRNHRYWDFASTAYDPAAMRSDAFNWLDHQYLQVSFEHDLCDAIAWGPYLRWDCRDGELDEVGTWIDFRTDCLGFRFSVSYDNEYQCVDGAKYSDDWRCGFYIYLRAFGPSMGSPMKD